MHQNWNFIATILSGMVVFVSQIAICAEPSHWSYLPVVRPTVPFVDDGVSVNPIDRFVAKRLEQGYSQLSQDADRATLVRRVTLDLIGLPPTPAEVRSFVEDTSPDAYERLVDRLLGSPHYGEHWARPWLDLCHYADTDGYLTDQTRPVAWRYRAWLVDALNDGMPFDQFTIEQLAGDLLPEATIQQKLATGLLRQTLSNREGGADPVEFRVKQVIDRTSMVGEIWMGLTVGCAQCHDHKYDDISQQEFYELYAFLDAADEINIDAPLPDEREAYEAALPEYHRRRKELLAPLASEIEELQSRWEEKILAARDNPGKDWYWDRQWELLGLVWGGGLGEGQLEGWQIALLDPAKRSQLQKDRLLDYFLPKADTIDAARAKELKLSELNAELQKLHATLPKVTRAPTMMQTQTPRTTFVHLAGDFRDRGDEVSPGTLDVLPEINSTCLDRLALARWLVSEEHPLTARVAVNRMWQQFFGQGIVATVGDFGVRGTRPTDPELLDWLAGEFIRSGWNVKAMQRLIVTSATYRQATLKPLRLSAEQIRDAVLSTSGLWDSRVGGPSVRPPQPASVSQESYGNTWEVSEGGDRYRRGLYTWVQRTSPFAMHITFDAPNPNHICTRRDRSNTPLQALTLLNDPVIHEAAGALAQRVQREVNSDDEQRVTHAFRLCLARDPKPPELVVLCELLQRLRKDSELSKIDAASAPLASNVVGDPTWTILCSVLFNLHEFVTRN
ncbi:MAG: DUF1549 domain-containing protein [Planctomycetaceae bacterium]|nr:DUF1549 domain-containing protein [Planctomycetales bacterium]MCB9939291.1 DUF1549 domain-containing protein [Planctomycetaceae bacterium]